MQYNTIEFFSLFIIFLGLYYILPKKIRTVFLLVTSYAYCCSFSIKFTFFMFGVTVLSYVGSYIIRKISDTTIKRHIFILTLILSISFLAVFKYVPWMISLFDSLQRNLFWGYEIPKLVLIAPVGISFYTFRAVSFLIEVYTGKMQYDEVNFISYATYISFFPQLVSGPIERPRNYFSQLKIPKKFEYDMVKRGFLFFLFGLLKKIVIADRLSIYVNQIFDNVGEFSNATYYLVAILFYTMQIYFDFSGYSDMAIGLCNMMGFQCIKNFNRPYFSKSIAEFWRRWVSDE